jgi:hypothetical protein
VKAACDTVAIPIKDAATTCKEVCHDDKEEALDRNRLLYISPLDN